ncbi:MAG: glycosyltransferase [Planctomycetota bacterium]|nr:MAG: glycosyltransferase [Planctomycetota bacterium]
MLLSLFTPTHNPQFLTRLARSIANQTFTNFEWVIVPNGDAGEIRVDLPQARIVPYTGQTQNIGELKRFACQACRGDVLVEVDHDDELTPDCLAELAAAFSDPRVDFAYSNTCEIHDGQPWKYDEKFGWRYRPFTWDGQPQFECVAFDPTPWSFSKIWFAPNHVRAWRTSFYHRIGGHDSSQAVLDDHDLLCRTYIYGKVKHIDRCLYIYHVHPHNTCRGDQNQFIQTETLNIHDQYIYPLVERWCDLNSLRKIDLCGGLHPTPGYESIDLQGANITADLNHRWPFADGEIGLIRAHDALEHLHNPIHTMQEAHRCLTSGGWFLTLTPSTDGRGAFQDPTHVSFWNSNSFWYYTRPEQARFIHSPVLFEANRVKNFYPSDWHREHQIVYVKADLVQERNLSKHA